MATAPKPGAKPVAIPKSGYEKWLDTIKSAEGNAAWDSLDCDIQETVNAYNAHLSGKAGYLPLDWLMIKAMAWVETGAASAHWADRPMQIGNKGDPGLDALLDGKEGGDLIMPPAIQKSLTADLAGKNPKYNIQAGIGYLLMKTAKFGYETVYDSDQKIYEIEVRNGDSFYKIAKENGTVVKVLESMNPGVGALRLRMKLRYRKATVQKAIQGWATISTSFIAKQYNGNRDPEYSKKLDYVLEIFKKRKLTPCPK